MRESVTSYLAVISALLTVATLTLTVIAYKLKIKLTKAQTELVEKQKKDAGESSNAFQALVHRFETKFNSYLDYFSQIHIACRSDVALTHGFPSSDDTSSFMSNRELSLFDYRRTHYAAEKSMLCRLFLNTILNSNIFDGNARVVLVIDSGSTVFPIFDLLCKYYWNENYRQKLSRLVVITNNLPGMGTLISKGRKGNDISSEMLFKCHALPGVLEGKYSAALGADSISHLAFLVKELKESGNSVVISAISGNYISIEDGVLWRGEYHGAMKNAMTLLSDQLYILSPLGKIFDMRFSEINNIIRNSPNALFTEKAYSTLVNSEEVGDFLRSDRLKSSRIKKLVPDLLLDNRKVFLVTTRRKASLTGSYPIELFEYFSRISALLERKFSDGSLICNYFSPQTESEQVIYELKKYSSSPEHAYYNYEFPHHEMREQMKSRLRAS